MKNTLTFLAMFLIAVTGFSQKTVESIIKQRPVKVDKFNEAKYAYYFAMPFGKAKIINEALPDTVRLSKITGIDLVYTSYRVSNSFNQPNLNRDRLLVLKERMPELFNLDVEWNVVEQTAATSIKTAKNYYHGFILHFSDDEGEEAITFLEKIINQDTSIKKLEDSTVLEVFERQKGWKDMLIVADLTGSMSPHVGQILLWYKLNDKRENTKHFVFFNDGNNTEDYDKEIGRTGGIYTSSAKKFDEIERLAYQTIRGGNGGDWEENDFEALLKGLEECPACLDVIMIVDNDSPVRDYSLLNQIKKPIKVILCGVEDYINPQYLDLVRVTGGSLHTMEADLENLMDLNEGEVVEIGDKTYQIVEGRFQVLKKM